VKRVALLILALLSTFGPHASAELATFHPALGRATAALDGVRSPHAYAALREVWNTFDRADPNHVEEALVAAEQSARLDPPARAYAGMLAAYARMRRGDVAAARRKIDSLGFVRDWLVVGPFDNEGRNGLDVEMGPEADFASPIVLGRAYSGKERPVRWRAAPDAFPFGYLDFGALFRPEQKICAFATSFVRAKPGSKAPRAATAWVGASGSFALFWNGRKVLEDRGYRGHDADRFAATVALRPGYNDLTVKVCSGDSPPVVSVRLADGKGAPDPLLETTSSLLASAEAAKLAPKKSDGVQKTPAVPGAGPLGPAQAFAKLAAGKAPRAADLEAYARYLNLTGGDDQNKHEARDLARRAAEREPTVSRLLFAGELSEDRNQRREWVDKAEKLAAKSGRPNVDVLLARAEIARSGLSWQTASSYFDRVLALDPDHVDAIAGRVITYNTAGLRRTALVTLETAVQRNPKSILLLNMYASQLRGLGRSTEAKEAEGRYAALRFDDQAFISSQIDLATTRRDRAAAERWVERLLETDPDSQWAHGVAARTYRALGQSQRAVATYQRALGLAPEDVGTLRALADLQGELGRRDEQRKLLGTILQIRPQDKDVREYVEHIEPQKPRADEAWAWDSKRFLKLRHAPVAGQNRRVLRDLTVTTVYENGLSGKFRQVVFQPLNDAGAALARQYAFQYESDREVVQLRGARVYRGDGRTDEAVEYGEGAADDPSISMYTSARNFYVQFPRLDPGDVVELRYRIDEVTPRNEYADYFGEVVHLGSSEPVQNAEYVLITPKKRAFYIDEKVPGLTRETKERGDQRIYRFFAAKVAPIVPEAAMPPWSEVLGFVHVSTYKDWKDLGRWYWGLVKGQFDLDDETRRLAREVAKGAKTDQEKVRAVYDWVVKNTRYVALEFGIYGYKPRRCVQTVTRGWGDCKDKATVIVTLLEELGVPSTIVILRTQLRGDFRSNVPSLAAFDHAIVYVPSLNLYLDGTAEYTGSTELPDMDSGALALLVNKGDAKLTRVPERDAKKNLLTRTVTAVVSATGDAKLDLGFETLGSEASDWRRRYHAQATRRARINADLGREFPGFEIQAGAAGVVANDLQNLELAPKIEVRGTARGFARREGDTLSMAVTPGTRLTPTYASLSRRTQDVRIPSFSSVDDTFIIKLPAGAKVKSAPPSVSGTSPFGSFEVKSEVQAGQVVVKSRLEVSATRVPPGQYAAFKAFCADVDRALGARLVVTP
jgi:tetratricopeptide (TPR) repeat protein